MNKKALEISMREILAYVRLGTGGKSSVAQPRQTSRYCSCCKGPLPSHTRGTQYRVPCRLGAKPHTVYVSFVHRSGWQCRFFEWDLKTPVGKTLIFRDLTKFYELARRTNGLPYADSWRTIAYGIRAGVGGFYVRLTDVQYRVLQYSAPAADGAPRNFPK
jgi:hypothetical protein